MTSATAATNPAQQAVALPTIRFLLVIWWICPAIALLWCGIMLVTGQGWPIASAGVVASGLVAVTSTIMLLILTPWRPKALMRWPILWMSGHFLRLLLTPAGGLLLYSATPYGDLWFWLAVVAVYLATLAGETRLYVQSMNRLAPRRDGVSDHT